MMFICVIARPSREFITSVFVYGTVAVMVSPMSLINQTVHLVSLSRRHLRVWGSEKSFRWWQQTLLISSESRTSPTSSLGINKSDWDGNPINCVCLVTHISPNSFEDPIQSLFSHFVETFLPWDFFPRCCYFFLDTTRRRNWCAFTQKRKSKLFGHTKKSWMSWEDEETPVGILGM